MCDLNDILIGLYIIVDRFLLVSKDPTNLFIMVFSEYKDRQPGRWSSQVRSGTVVGEKGTG